MEITGKHKLKGFDIELRGKGFLQLPNAFGKVASFWVVNPERELRSIFAFGYSMLDAFAYTVPPEDVLVSEAIEKIKEYIKNDAVDDLHEYTFEYKDGQFIYDEHVPWWRKNLKRLLEKEKDNKTT